MNSMWYMSMILLLYLMLPIVSVALKRIGNEYLFWLCMVVMVLSMVVPNVNTFLSASGIDYGIETSLSYTDLFSYYMIYVLLGYWISSGCLSKLNAAAVYGAFAASFILTALFQFFIYSSPIDYHVRYADVGIVISSALLFEMYRRNVSEKSGHRSIVQYISKISFGIYFVHICIMTVLMVLLENVEINPFINLIALETISFAGSVLFIYTLSKITVFKKYLFLIKE